MNCRNLKRVGLTLRKGLLLELSVLTQVKFGMKSFMHIRRYEVGPHTQFLHANLHTLSGSFLNEELYAE
jgi:hypothetical protein